MDESSLIREFFLDATPAGDDVVLGIGDDAAVLEVPAPWQLVVCTDTLVAGHHFPPRTAAADIAWKALAVNLSDLAAMGAVPRWFTLALTLPRADADWLRDFRTGLAALARSVPLSLVGGDTTRGPLSVTVTAGGWVEPGQALGRHGARVGDVVCVTGTLGDAALALRRLQASDVSITSAALASGDAQLRRRLDRPEPRVAAGRILREFAHAAIDISDGLVSELGHILVASAPSETHTSAPGCGALIDLRALPCSPAFDALAPAGAAGVELQLAGGDDYELCVCLERSDVDIAQRRLAAIGVVLTPIGRILGEPGLWLEDDSGRRPCTLHGFDHFGRRTR